MSAHLIPTALFVTKHVVFEDGGKPMNGTLSFTFREDATDQEILAEANRILLWDREDGEDFLVQSIRREDRSNSNNWTGVPVAQF